MTKQEPKILELGRFVDDRGSLDQIYNSVLNFKLKRIYFISPLRGIIRGMHGHKREWKAFVVLRGSVTFVTHPMGIKSSKASKIFTLNSKKPQILVIPKRYYNGFVALENESEILGLSSSTLAESLKDDFRKPWNEFGDEPWEVDYR